MAHRPPDRPAPAPEPVAQKPAMDLSRLSIDDSGHLYWDGKPVEVRRRNFQGANTTTVNGQRVTSNGFDRCLDMVESASEWKTRRGRWD